MTLRRPPLIVVEDEALIPAVRAELQAEGWIVQDGWPTSRAWRTGDQRVVCLGRVEEPADREAALVASVAAGTGILTVLPRDSPQMFLEDLRRVGPVECRSAARAPAPLTDLQVALLRALADGQSVADAARTVGLSVRSAYRALAAARTVLGVRKNREALIALARWDSQAGSETP